MTHLKLHFADLLYGRPCCGTERGIVTRELGEVTCKRCRTIVDACDRAMRLASRYGRRYREVRDA